MRWRKGGLIYKQEGKHPWGKTHAQCPIVDVIDDRVLRIYFGTRDEENRTYTTYNEFDAKNPKEILYEHDEPVLTPGDIGTFDDCGAMPSWIVNYEDKKYLYYIGWTVRNTIPYHNSIGLAVSIDGGKSFKKFSNGPIFSPTYIEPYFTGTSCVLIDEGIWKNWYLSCTKWEVIAGKAEPFYHIKYAESKDGINWVRNGKVAIDFKDENEGGIVKASVIKEKDLYQMWYSYRKGSDYRINRDNSYRIGYAESGDGKIWVRKDAENVFSGSDDGWDSEMQAYPHVIKYAGKKHIFYNGNGFGRSGFGYAIEE